MGDKYIVKTRLERDSSYIKLIMVLVTCHRVSQVWSINFATRLVLGVELNLVLLASTTNVESGP